MDYDSQLSDDNHHSYHLISQLSPDNDTTLLICDSIFVVILFHLLPCKVMEIGWTARPLEWAGRWKKVDHVTDTISYIYLYYTMLYYIVLY